MNSYQRRVLITVILGFIGVLGVALIINTFVDLSTLFANQDDKTIDTSIKSVKQSEYTDRSDVKGLNTSTTDLDSTISIKKEILSKEIIRPYLQIDTDKNIILAKIINSGEISPIYILPLDSTNIQFYEDDVITYIRNIDNKAEINIQKSNQKKSFTINTDNIFEILDIKYSNAEDIFYLLIKQKDQFSLIWSSETKPKLNLVKNLINLDGVVEQIVDTENNSILLANKFNDLCYRLNLLENTFKKTECVSTKSFEIKDSGFYLKDNQEPLFNISTAKTLENFFIYHDLVLYSERSLI
ncbi:hypothetical protein KC669_04555, partial [Candidatus Dojkabacteria bacterium]|nr:hypothetical protein [Candidatus Dojkabacteria bacterium]